MSTSAPSAIPDVQLLDGTSIPQLGYGVWQIPDDIAAKCVTMALISGYRSIDTAMIYENERGVGAALRSIDIPRNELYVTTKLWNSDHNRVGEAFDESLERLGLDYVDLYLMHWPAPQTGDYRAAWQSMIELRDSGRARSIGVSNFAIEHLEQIAADTGVLPTLNQVELHPFFQQRELRAWCGERDVAVEAWSPLGRGGTLLETPTILRIAEKHGRTPAQVVLRWDIQLGLVTIPKSATPARIQQNLRVFDFELDTEDMAEIEALDSPTGRIGPDPMTASF